MNSDELMKQGIAAYKAGSKAEARSLFQEVLKLDRYNETTWLWLISVVETDDERIACLERVLEINPANDKARRGLERLSAADSTWGARTEPQAAPQSDSSQLSHEPMPDWREANGLIQEPSEQATVQEESNDQSHIGWPVIAGSILLLVAFFILLLGALTRSEGKQVATSLTPSPDPRRAITAVVFENIAAHNAEDIDRYMATVHSDFPNFRGMRRTLKEMYDMYDLRATLRGVKVIEVSKNKARVSFVLTTKKVRGPAFKNNRVEGVFILRKDDGDWKLFDQEIENVEYL